MATSPSRGAMPRKVAMLHKEVTPSQERIRPSKADTLLHSILNRQLTNKSPNLFTN